MFMNGECKLYMFHVVTMISLSGQLEAIFWRLGLGLALETSRIESNRLQFFSLARVMFSIDSRFRKRGYVLYARKLLATMLILTCNQEDWLRLMGGFGMSLWLECDRPTDFVI